MKGERAGRGSRVPASLEGRSRSYEAIFSEEGAAGRGMPAGM